MIHTCKTPVVMNFWTINFPNVSCEDQSNNISLWIISVASFGGFLSENMREINKVMRLNTYCTIMLCLFPKTFIFHYLILIHITIIFLVIIGITLVIVTAAIRDLGFQKVFLTCGGSIGGGGSFLWLLWLSAAGFARSCFTFLCLVCSSHDKCRAPTYSTISQVESGLRKPVRLSWVWSQCRQCSYIQRRSVLTLWIDNSISAACLSDPSRLTAQPLGSWDIFIW